jgi:hypothetical protein
VATAAMRAETVCPTVRFVFSGRSRNSSRAAAQPSRPVSDKKTGKVEVKLSPVNLLLRRAG